MAAAPNAQPAANLLSPGQKKKMSADAKPVSPEASANAQEELAQDVSFAMEQEKTMGWTEDQAKTILYVMRAASAQSLRRVGSAWRQAAFCFPPHMRQDALFTHYTACAATKMGPMN